MNFVIATFLRTPEGEFNYPAALFSLLFGFFIFGGILALIQAFKTGRILVSLAGPRGGNFGKFYVERQKNPFGFWFVVAVYCFGMLVMTSLVIGFCFDLFGKLGPTHRDNS